jgi:hypothetical protein
MSKIYLICPVRNASKDQLEGMREYVANLEAQGHEVHFPPRDVDQSNDDGGVRICYEHRAALFECDRVDIYWDPMSYGSHFDLGMAFMLSLQRVADGLPPIEFVTAHAVDKVKDKSFQNVLVNLVDGGANPIFRKDN